MWLKVLSNIEQPGQFIISNIQIDMKSQSPIRNTWLVDKEIDHEIHCQRCMQIRYLYKSNTMAGYLDLRMSIVWLIHMFTVTLRINQRHLRS